MDLIKLAPCRGEEENESRRQGGGGRGGGGVVALGLWRPILNKAVLLQNGHCLLLIGNDMASQGGN